MLETILSYIPPGPGLLPKWLFLVAIIALGNSVQAYRTLYFNKRIYSATPDQVNGLSSRTFGTWTLLQSIVRLYGAYNLTNPTVYDLCFWTYIIAFWHFMSEWQLFKTASLKGEGLYFPVIIASVSIVWFYMQRDYYLGL